MKLAILQFAPELGNLSATIETLKHLFRKVQSADVVVLPELANSGYNFESKKQATACSEAVENSVFLQFIQNECKNYGFSVATGFSEQEGDALYNSAVVVDKTGVLGKYRKLHLFMRIL